MNYTKTVREYCLQNKGGIFEVAYMMDRYFDMIPYKTLLKILNRLEEEGILTCAAKGIYLINGDGVGLDEAIVNRYISDGNGMYAGQTLFNKLGLTDYKGEFIEIYTSRLQADHRTIGKYKLTRIDLPFSEQLSSMVALLEILEKGNTAVDINLLKSRDTRMKLAEEYSDRIFYVILDGYPCHYSTVVVLNELLDDKGIANDCLNVYRRRKMK